MIKTIAGIFHFLAQVNYALCLFKPGNHLTIESIPGPVCFSLKFSSAKGPPPYILQTPVPSPWQ